MAAVAALGALPKPISWSYLGLVATTAAFGFETIRALISLLVYVLRESYGWNPLEVGIVALVIFSTGFQAGKLTRLLGAPVAFLLSAGGLGLMRFLAQIWAVYPLVDLCLTVAGVTFFILFIFALVEFSRQKDGLGAPISAIAFLLGISLNTFIMGVFHTWEPFWRTGAGSIWTAGIMFMAQVYFIAYVGIIGKLFDSSPTARDASEATPDRIVTALPWVAIGPVIFLQLQVFQNLASFAAATGWTLPQTFLCMVISNIAGLVVAALIVSRPSLGGWAVTLILGALSTVAVVLSPESPSTALAAALIVGNACLSGLLVVVFSALATLNATPPEQPSDESKDLQAGAKPGSGFYGTGMILLMALLFGYYASLELEMPFSREMLLPAAAVIVGLAALRASIVAQRGAVSYFPVWRPAALAGLFAIAPVVMLLTWQAPQPEAGNGYPVRVMSYNLHNGFNTDGELDLEELAEVIEDEEADIVGLQEVSRGWVINGSADMLLWLSTQLNMPYVYGPSIGHMWGNAILSRFPITDWGTVDLPPRDIPLLRQFTWADFDIGGGEQLRVITTHFHYRKDGGAVRLQQTEAVLSFWNGHPQTVVLGDLNAAPGWPEMLGFWRTGFSDALDEVEDRTTFPSDKPVDTIDYVLASADLKLSDPSITKSTASDHLPVSATVDLRN